MPNRSIVIMGLPSSGKTTFLAALWHLITAREVETELKFGGLHEGDSSHLNGIARRWRDALIQIRTAGMGRRLVSMNLENSDGEAVRVTFPDLPGEAYQGMWEDRDCDQQVASILQAGGVQLFIHSDTIREPQWVVEEAEVSRQIGIEVPRDQPPVEWEPRLAPTQVQLVDLLQMLRKKPLDIGPRRLAIMFSAWDKASGDGLTPSEYLKCKMPLLWQYLQSNADDWMFKIYGLSAQGGDYDHNEEGGNTVPGVEELRALDLASKRIRLVGSNLDTSDLTEPLKWLMG